MNNYSFSKLCIKVLWLVFVLSIPTVSSASNGPSVQQLQKTLNSTWNKLLKVTNCDKPPPQDAICMQKLSDFPD
jgi:type III secretory pathway component EscS